MKKIFNVFVIILAFWMGFFNPINLSLIYAQEATPIESPLASPEPSAEAGTPTPDQTLITGDTTATSDSETTSNESDITTSPTPTESPAPSDSPTPSDILSSESTESADTTLLSTESPTPTPSPLDISVNQLGDTSSNTTSQSTSGGNSQESSDPGQGSAVMTTGNTVSTANSITVTNLSQVNSNLIIAIQNILTSDTQSIDLYLALEAAIANNPNFVPENANISVNQTANENTNTQSTAVSGGNSQNSGEVTMTTGNALALANAINAVNLNLVGSNTLITIINILADWNGNIILPNGTQLSVSSLGTGNINLDANQNGIVNSNTQSFSNSGGNMQIGEGQSMTTGSSASLANSGTLTNIIQIGNGLGFLIINNLGGWTGNLINWSAPGSVESFGAGNYNLTTNYDNAGEGNSIGNTNITSNQIANVNTNVSAGADTGHNYQNGISASLMTGNALALANNFTLANLTSVGVGIFFGVINILGSWTGNIIGAYPQLQVAITDNQDSINPGGAENYILTVTNTGKAVAHGVSLKFNWPDLVIPDQNQDNFWNLGDFAPGQSRTFNLFGYVLGSASENSQLLASANASTNDTQDSVSGNNATDTTTVINPDNFSNPPPDNRTPDLSVSIWNSVGEYVLPGDTIWVSITINNNSPFIARSVDLVGSISDDLSKNKIPLNWHLGDIRANGKVKITFNVTLPKDISQTTYKITAQATGLADSGDSSTSNLAVSEFLVKGQLGTSLSNTPPVIGETNIFSPPPVSGGEVLGANTNNFWLNSPGKHAPYVFSGLALIYLALILAKRKLNGQIVIPAFPILPKIRKAALARGLFTLIAAIGVLLKRNP